MAKVHVATRRAYMYMYKAEVEEQKVHPNEQRCLLGSWAPTFWLILSVRTLWCQGLSRHDFTMLRSTQSSIPVLLKVWSAARYRGRGGLVTGPQIDTKILFCTMQCENMVYSFILTLKYIKCYIMINILQWIEALIIIVSSSTSVFIKNQI